MREVVTGRAEGHQVREFSVLWMLVFPQRVQVVDVNDLTLEVKIAGTTRISA